MFQLILDQIIAHQSEIAVFAVTAITAFIKRFYDIKKIKNEQK